MHHSALCPEKDLVHIVGPVPQEPEVEKLTCLRLRANVDKLKERLTALVKGKSLNKQYDREATAT